MDDMTPRKQHEDEPQQASALMRSMEHNWKDAASAREIAQQSYLSRFHFQRVFRQNTGVPRSRFDCFPEPVAPTMIRQGNRLVGRGTNANLSGGSNAA